ncbi:major intrinsically disordered NOTCH2-binding receptor 1-like [Serinus canaria]|uniref:major intrinsically disordered NOTCH2-binding receptor 1-like n=1 Tax=Serinus canaria TaxID=9135 RepID=UPI0021CC520E|nr:major intrinsically disordered NOTCH2-binding receptor 1-like [Serinus canaria]
MHSQEAEAGAVFIITLQHRNMDLSVLPNNNHPDKFLQLEVKSLVKNSAFLPANWAKFPEAALPGVQRWHNRIYLQREKRTVTELPGLDLNRVSQEIIDKSLGKHITPITLKSTIKSNPLYSDIHVDDDWEEKKKNPSWTVQDYDRQSLHSNLASHIKENPNDLQFWMGDIYTPGYDTLLKKKEREKKHSKYCRIILLTVLAICILITVITLRCGGRAALFFAILGHGSGDAGSFGDPSRRSAAGGGTPRLQRAPGKCGTCRLGREGPFPLLRERLPHREGRGLLLRSSESTRRGRAHCPLKRELCCW